MNIVTIQTGYTLVSSAVPDRASRKNPLAYTGLLEKRKNRIKVPVKCFYVEVSNHAFLVDAGWSEKVVTDPKKHLGFGLYFASEPVMKKEEAAKYQLKDKKIERILMTHLDCDHISGLHDFHYIPVMTSKEEFDAGKSNHIRYGKLLSGLSFDILKFKYDKDAIFQKSCDIYGDGSVTAYLTPTHSAGSIIYKIADGAEYALIVGDNGYNEKSWNEGRLPGPLYNADNMKKCLDWIKECSLDSACKGIYCAHDFKMR